MSELLHFAEHRLQEFALLFMVIVYFFRIRWLLKYKAGKDRQATTGYKPANISKGILYSWVNIASPHAMESTRKHLFFYFQFALFHIGVTAAITLSFIIPYAPHWLKNPVVLTVFQAFIGVAFLVGLARIVRRATQKYIRAISTPDDYFSLILLTVWFFFAFWAAPNNHAEGETILIIYFFMTAFFLMYVPFSKICHYLYYPFTRYYLGKTMAHRGVFPVVHNTK